MDKIKEAQEQLKFYKMDGWLLYEFHGYNSLALHFLEIPEGVLMTRRTFYWIPVEGVPIKIVHGIEAHNLDHMPGEKKLYSRWRELHALLHEVLKGKKRIAMEFSPMQTIPTVSKVDGGLVDLIRTFGPEVVSSAPFLQVFTCCLTDEQYALHCEAGKVVDEAVNSAWNLIRNHLQRGQDLTEYDVQQHILGEFEKAGCVTEGAPICAVNGNGADPHYVPQKDSSHQIKKGDFILIDLWCRKNVPQSVFADITRVGVAASEPTSRQQEVFSLVLRAQKAGIDLIKKRYAENAIVRGCDVDAKVHKVIEDGGYGSYFTHRTGHSITNELHGPGANLDSFETEDERPLIPRTCFSVEPGIYLPGEFGIRLESDVYIHEDGQIAVTPSVQEKIITLL